MKRTSSPRAVAHEVAPGLSRAEFLYGWIDTHAAARHLGVGSPSAVYRLIQDWRLPYGRKGDEYRFRRADLDQWMERRSAGALEAVQGGRR